MNQTTTVRGGASASTRGRRRTRRVLALVIVAALVGALAGLLLGLLRSDSHRATASMLVAPLDGNPFRPGGRGDDLTNLFSEAQLVASDAVVHAVIQAEGASESVAQMRSGLQVDVPANTQVIEVTYTASDDDTAVSRAQGFVDAYLAYRAAQAEDLVDRRTERINDQIEQRNAELRTLFAQRNAAEGGREALLSRQIETVAGEVSVLRSQEAELSTTSLYPGDVVRPGTVAQAGALGSSLTFTLLGALVGAVVGLILGLVRSQPRGRLHHAEDVAAAGVPLLGTVTPAEARTARERFPLGGAESMGLSTLRAALLTAHPQRPATILLAQAGSHLRAPATAVGIAQSLAAAEVRVVLVDATGSGAGLTDALGQGGAPGLTDVLQGRVDLGTALVTGREHLALLPSGGAVENLDDLVVSERMRQLVTMLRQRAEVVLLVTGSIHHPLAQSLALVADSVVLEVGDAHATFADVTEATGPDSTAAAKVAGAVFVGHPPTRQHRFERSATGQGGADAATPGLSPTGDAGQPVQR